MLFYYISIRNCKGIILEIPMTYWNKCLKSLGRKQGLKSIGNAGTHSKEGRHLARRKEPLPWRTGHEMLSLATYGGKLETYAAIGLFLPSIIVLDMIDIPKLWIIDDLWVKYSQEDSSFATRSQEAKLLFRPWQGSWKMFGKKYCQIKQKCAHWKLEFFTVE